MATAPYITTVIRPARKMLHGAAALGISVTVAALFALTGCAKPAGVIFEPLATPIGWPAPPDEPRIHYVGQISTTADLKAAKPFGEALRELFAGKQPIMGVINPFAVETDNHNRLFVADSGGQVVHVFDLDKRTYEQWTPKAPAAFISPVGLARAADGRLFVADSAAGAIWVFDALGAEIGRWGDDELIRPCGLAYDDVAQRLFIADAGAHQVVILDTAGQPVARLGSRGTAPGQFNFPTNVAIDHHHRLYVSDSLNCRVQQFVEQEGGEVPGDAAGASSEQQPAPAFVPRLQIGSRGDMPGYFSRPKGIAVDSEDHLYIVDAEFEAVQVYSSEGNLLMAFGREGRGPGEFWLPAGLCIDDTDRLWIADPYNRRVQVFDYRRPQIAAPGLEPKPLSMTEATP